MIEPFCVVVRKSKKDMRIYSSLSPLDFHARGAELCRVILLRDADCMQRFGHGAFSFPFSFSETPRERANREAD